MESDRNRLVAAKQLVSEAFLAPPLLRPRWMHALGLIQQQAFRGEVFRPDLLDTFPLVHAVGIGRKQKDGERTGTPAVRVYVTRKAGANELGVSETIPKTVEGVLTDVIEAPPARFLGLPPGTSCTQSRTGSCRPLIGGMSTSHVRGDTGTIGYFCRSTDAQDSASDVFVLSNAHIYAKYGAAGTGDDLVQPGASDGGTSADRAGGFQRAIPLVFGGARNDVDAAIGKLDGGIGYKAEICAIGKVNGTAQAAEDDEVAKHGRTSGYTEGIIDDELIDFMMLPDHSLSYIQFRDQMRIVPLAPAFASIAKDGDSGSLVVKKGGNEAVGLLHSTAIDGSYAYASHIDTVLSQLRVALL
jgi:hypothetical protein